MFRDRQDAGARLATALADRITGGELVILGIPRGGVIVAEPVARALGAPLYVVVPRKLGAPGNPELAIGAVAPGVRVLDDRLIGALAVPDDYVEREVAAQEREIERRTRRYRGNRPPVSVRGATAVVVDDGVATGSTAMAALRWARDQGAVGVVFAAPVGPAAAVPLLASVADRVVILETPPSFHAVGEWYDAFDQVTDEEVFDALRREPDP